MNRSTDPGVLYVVACGSPISRDVDVLVCVVTTPDGRKFVDVGELARLTGHPVRSSYKDPGDADLLPPADAIIVAPATVNTLNKWACGIADTLALGLLIESFGLGLPTIAVPYTNIAMAAHPTVHESVARLRSWGVDVLFGDGVVTLHPPGTGERHRDSFPWRTVLDRLRSRWNPAHDAERPPVG
jgi:phosphopantothenoylcysteine decarboxylase